MKSARVHSKGYTLIASLLLMTLLSAMAIGLLMMVNTEQKVGGTDIRNDVAFHVAEGGIEKMASDVAVTFQNSQAPTVGQICSVNSTPPSIPGVTWTTYSVTPEDMVCPPPDPTAAPPAKWNRIFSGPNQGLWAQVIPINMLASASLLGGQEVTMMRSAQVALIPVFQFGVFCEGDCSFFSGPNFDMVGPVHTNGDLYPFVGNGSTLVFHNKVEAYGNVVRTQLSNGWNASNNYNGTVWVPTQDGGCTALTAAGNCTAMAAVGTAYGDGSVTGAGGNPPHSTYIPSLSPDTWTPFSASTANHELINGDYYTPTGNALPGTGAKKLSMPFVGGNVLPYEIIRRPVPGEDPKSPTGTSREYNMAQIRVLLSDDPTEFTNGTGYTDLDNVRLANLSTAENNAQGGPPAGDLHPWGIPIVSTYYNAAMFGTPTPAGAGYTFNLYFAAASNVVPTSSGCLTSASCTQEWPSAPLQWNDPIPANKNFEGLQPAGIAPIYLNQTTATFGLCQPTTPPVKAGIVPPSNCQASGTAPVYPYYVPANANGATVNNSAAAKAWSLIDGYLRVEYKDAGGAWHPVTREWLGLGFARGLTPPTAPATNPITPNAILLLQEPADRGTLAWPPAGAQIDGVAPTCTATVKISNVNYCTAWGGTVPLLTADLPATAAGIAKDAAGISADWAFGVTPPNPPATTPQSLTQYNWYPINFYDAREGEVRDTQVTGNNSCATNGVMNAVEIDVGNLKRWLAGVTGQDPATGKSSGPSVDFLAQNGYVLYYSDRRGMLLNPNKTGPHPAGTKSGDSGLEDVINRASQAGTPDKNLEAPPPNAPQSPTGVPLSPEDDNENGVLDNWGTANMGLGFYNGGANLNTVIAPVNDPFTTRIASCSTTGRKNWVSGARHVLRLVDGSLGNLPLRQTPIVVHNSDGTTTKYYGGFTVASENPVYILGDYNTNAASFGKDTPGQDSAASVIADAVSLLSNSWTDFESFGINTPNTSVTDSSNNRNATDTYYRLAIAGGKNMSFTQPTWSGVYQDFGTDGGVHNFLRYLEDWSGKNLSYKGSLVSLYYATYNTGVYKCGNGTVYSPPTRNYSFDADFDTPEGLPPGTPMFRDVESLGYRQVFTPRTQ